MLYIVFYLFLAVGYVLGAPVSDDYIEYHFVECVSGENETSSRLLFEITSANETCIHITKTPESGEKVELFVIPDGPTSIRVQITTDNCSTSIPDLVLSVCDDNTNLNNTVNMVTAAYHNANETDTMHHTESMSTHPITTDTPSTELTTTHGIGSTSTENDTHEEFENEAHGVFDHMDELADDKES